MDWERVVVGLRVGDLVVGSVDVMVRESVVDGVAVGALALEAVADKDDGVGVRVGESIAVQVAVLATDADVEAV